MSAHAFCWASGEIKIGKRVPKGALPLNLRGDERKVKAFVERFARHAYDGVTMLVPGVPEAPNQGVAVKALARFCDWIHSAAVADGLRVNNKVSSEHAAE
jgi:hypothetical protein